MFTFLLPAVVICLFGQQIPFGLEFKGRGQYATPYILHWDTHTQLRFASTLTKWPEVGCKMKQIVK